MLARTTTFKTTTTFIPPTTSSSTVVDATIAELEQRISDLEAEITPLRSLATKKLNKIEKELENCNFLMDSGIGSKADQAALRKTKRQLRNRRIQLWKELEVLPELEAEHKDLLHHLVDFRRRHGIIDA